MAYEQKHDISKEPSDKMAGLAPQRLYSLDALRGFDMLMIIGLDNFFHKLAKASPTPFWTAISDQFHHPSWNGFHFYDLIFPLFLFIAGVATPYSLENRLKKGDTKGQLLKHVIQRGLILVLLGVIYNNGLQIKPLAEIRFGSVLGRIGLAYMFANIIYLYTKQKGQIIWFTILLIGYWMLLRFTSAPGFPAGDLSMEGNFVSYFDRLFLPGKLYETIHDPEGILATIPAIGTGLMGILTGNFLKSGEYSSVRKTMVLAIAGIISLVFSLIWNLDFPINKNLWTSSFVLCTGGFSLLLIALFYYIVDVRGFQKWAFPLKVIGMNSILIYLAGEFISWNYTNEALFKWLGQLVGEQYGPVVLAATIILVQWLFLYFLYRKKIFLKV
ncbi:MAG: DUF5009 domain-containing protein [Chitinophagaceae bacterium]|nr:DUF5009 domain-containing protein [Chitinophagaceae bacterium]